MPEEPKKFADGQRGYYEDEAEELTRGVPEDLEGSRTSFHIHPIGPKTSISTACELPYNADCPQIDAYIARNLVRMLHAFADRMREVGTADTESHEWTTQFVDLSNAAGSTDRLDHDDAGIRESFLDLGDSDESTSIRERDVAAHGTSHSDDDVDGQTQSDHNAAVRESLDQDRTDDMGASGDEGGAGGRGVMLGQLDSEGSAADPSLCAKKSSDLLCRIVIEGIGDGEFERPSLVDRLEVLVPYGVVTSEQIAKIVGDLQEKYDELEFIVRL